MDDQARAPLICPECKRPMSPTAHGALALDPTNSDFSEAQRERIRLIVLQILRDLRAFPGTIPGEFR